MSMEVAAAVVVAVHAGAVENGGEPLYLYWYELIEVGNDDL